MDMEEEVENEDGREGDEWNSKEGLVQAVGLNSFV